MDTFILSSLLSGGKRHKSLPVAGVSSSSVNSAGAVGVVASVLGATEQIVVGVNSNSGSVVGSGGNARTSSPLSLPGGGTNGEASGANGGGGYNSEDEYSHYGINLTEEEWIEKDRRFERMMKKKGYVIKLMVEDGSCLFRSVADQIYGDQEMHAAVRSHCMNYIVSY